MMLQALIAYAERNNLGDADFETVGARWLISLSVSGDLAGVIPLAVGSDGNKPRPRRVDRPKSDPDFVSHGRSYFLCDSLERSVLLVDEDAKLEKRKINQAYFVNLLDAAAKECPVASGKLRLLSAFLRDEQRLKLLHGQLLASKAKTSDNAIFSVDGENLIDSEEIRNWWRIRSGKERGQQQTEKSVCLATGRFGPVCRTTGFIKLLGDDTKLISFNKECPAFESFGLSQAANAPIGVDAEIKFGAALNTLIEKSREQKLTFNDTAHLHWTREPIVDDPIDLLASADENAVGALLKSFHTGRPPIQLDEEKYYAMSISSNGTRIVVRDWLESSVSEIKWRVAEWFQDIGIVSPDGSGVKRDFKFYALLYGLVRKELEELPPQMSTQLLYSALRGRSVPLPKSILALALRRQQLDQESKLNPARMAIIKVCLIRSPNRKEETAMTEQLDIQSKDRAYLCGQLFAVIGRLQLLALGKIGASLADRTYGGIATRPATTFGPVFTKLPAYLKKANTRFPGSGTNKQKELEILCRRIEDLGGIPQILGLEDQGRFALGYYCQLAQYRTDRAEAEAARKNVGPRGIQRH